jgi:UTP-glucose-1-phosphate uridylyltransferase
MNKNIEIKPTVVVLAAGLASRYGSLKQIDQFGPSGETIIDYSIYDAIRAGFKKVVFIIRRNIEQEFKEVFVGKFQSLIEIDFAFQEINIVPEGIIVPPERIKPWGTGHAVLMASEKVNSPFAVINADDFYGSKSFKLLFNHLVNLDSTVLNGCLIGYRLKNTLSDHGYVSRGICTLSPENYLQKVTERTHITKGPEGVINYLEHEKQEKLTGDELVSMNLVGFTPPFFNILKTGFERFAIDNASNPKAEFYLPDAVTQMIKQNSVRMPVLETPELTYGVTYPDDKPIVKEMLMEMVRNGIYPKNLWA